MLGRDPTANVVVDVVGVSRRHAMIVVSAEEVTLHDLASKNGTFANGERITDPVRLPDDTEIRLGPVPIRFRRLDQTVSTQTLDASHVSRSSR
jgi:pSer/pThr/pTyr-binding forkhead associated (FHA) protein